MVNPATAEVRHIILFDGVCNLCNGFVQTLLRIDKKEIFTFGSLQSEATASLRKEFAYSEAGDLPDAVVYIRGQQSYNRTHAVINIVRDLGGIYQIAAIALVVPRPARDWIYNVIARRRYSIFGKRQSCMVPTPEVKRRFID